ncbi:MAG TPA: hypothetical protein VG295_08065 [Solirubrobacteraceae bacterium]|jgi:hypothetical protein|nr:hypothetical protein [Solirubrobacteraceae bacterium]
MNPVTRLFRRSRAFRILLYLAMVPLWALIVLLSLDSLGAYTTVGNLTVLALIMSFALWAWWYGEDRDRREAAKVAPSDGVGSSGANGHPPPAA